MNSEQSKVFVGGIPWETTEERLKDYFRAFGDVVEAVIMKDRATGRARGFGFVEFADTSVVERVLMEKHTVDGRSVSTSLSLSPLSPFLLLLLVLCCFIGSPCFMVIFCFCVALLLITQYMPCTWENSS